MKSKLSAAPITTQFRLKVVCVQCSDEISTVSLFFLFVSVCVFRCTLCLWYGIDWMWNYFALVVCLYACSFDFLFAFCLFVCLFVCAYWRLWIVSGGCSVWQMRILEDIIMFSSSRKYFNENLQSTTLSIIFFTMSKEREYFRGYWCREKLTILFVQVWRGAGFRDVILIGRRKSLKERIHGAPTDLLTLPLRASKDSSFSYSFFLISYGSVCAGWEFWLFNVLFLFFWK